MIADVERVILFLPVGAVRTQENRVGILERGGVVGPAFEMGFDPHPALQVRRSVEQMLEQDDALLVFVRLLRVTGNGARYENDLLGRVRRETGRPAKQQWCNDKN